MIMHAALSVQFRGAIVIIFERQKQKRTDRAIISCMCVGNMRSAITKND